MGAPDVQLERVGNVGLDPTHDHLHQHRALLHDGVGEQADLVHHEAVFGLKQRRRVGFFHHQRLAPNERASMLGSGVVVGG